MVAEKLINYDEANQKFNPNLFSHVLIHGDKEYLPEHTKTLESEATRLWDYAMYYAHNHGDGMGPYNISGMNEHEIQEAKEQPNGIRGGVLMMTPQACKYHLTAAIEVLESEEIQGRQIDLSGLGRMDNQI